MIGNGRLGREGGPCSRRRRSRDATIDYKREDVAGAVRDMTGGRGVDAVIDMDFSTTAGLIGAGILAPHGTIVSYGSNTADDGPSPFGGCCSTPCRLKLFIVYQLTAEDRRRAIDGITEMMAAGRLDHTIGAPLPTRPHRRSA
ncbi:MAG: zinc-binding dehydrogenase [Aliidongia sp.]